MIQFYNLPLNVLRLYSTNILLFLTLFNFIDHLSELRQQILRLLYKIATTL